MAEVRAFRGLRFNPDFVKNLGEVVCPPYDVITPEEQKVLYERSPYNIVRVEHCLAVSGDTTNGRHLRAAAMFDEWCRQGILRLDDKPAIYVHDQLFGRLKRRDFIARVRLEPPETKTILPHENTVPGIKSDRLVLLRACKANISPIMLLYRDRSGEIADILEHSSKSKALAEFTMPEGESHYLWAITEKSLLDRISQLLANERLYIADGHHRYETSLAYQQERCAQLSPCTGQEGFNFIMASMISFDDPGLVVLPIHRIVNNLTPNTIARLRDEFERIFDVRYVPLYVLSDFVEVLNEAGVLFVVVGLKPGLGAVCKLRVGFDVDAVMPSERSPVYRRLPVSLLHHLVLDKLPEYSGGKGVIQYTHDWNEACEIVRRNSSSVAVLMPPTVPLTIKEIADAGDRMPGKSTFFYPKLPTGLVINCLEL